MNQTQKRSLIAAAIIVVVAGLVLGIDAWRRSRAAVLEPGSIPIYLDGDLSGRFLPIDLEKLEKVSFVDAEEGKIQEGWLLRKVLILRLKKGTLQPDTQIVVSSSSRGKSVELTWAEVDDVANRVLFDLSGRSTLKLVSTLERLDVRDEWIQDVDKIEVWTP